MQGLPGPSQFSSGSHQPGPSKKIGSHRPEQPVVPPQYYAPLNATLATSNVVIEPELWLERARNSSYRFVRLIPRRFPGTTQAVFTRLAMPIIVAPSACIDFGYNLIWLLLKTGIVFVRGTIRILTCGRRGHFAEQVTTQDLRFHMRMTGLFLTAVPVATVTSVIKPDAVVNTYRKYRMIMTDDERKQEDLRMRLLSKQIQLAQVKQSPSVVLNQQENPSPWMKAIPSHAVHMRRIGPSQSSTVSQSDHMVASSSSGPVNPQT